jgi:AcrR family transcriptional regulator
MRQIKRKSTRVYAKGAVRRDRLLDAAALLLGSHEMGELSLKDISERAGIPVGSAYHFFSNAQDVYAALAQRFMESLFTLVSEPYKGKAIQSWQHLFDAAIDRGAALYAENPAYRQLIIGGNAPPEIKLADRVNDERVGQLMIDVIGRHFTLKEFPGDKDVFFFATEIVDLMFSLSVIRHGVITPEMLKEAKKAGKAYLRQYLPEEVPART